MNEAQRLAAIELINQKVLAGEMDKAQADLEISKLNAQQATPTPSPTAGVVSPTSMLNSAPPSAPAVKPQFNQVALENVANKPAIGNGEQSSPSRSLIETPPSTSSQLVKQKPNWGEVIGAGLQDVAKIGSNFSDKDLGLKGGNLSALGKKYEDKFATDQKMLMAKNKAEQDRLLNVDKRKDIQASTKLKGSQAKDLEELREGKKSKLDIESGLSASKKTAQDIKNETLAAAEEAKIKLDQATAKLKNVQATDIKGLSKANKDAKIASTKHLNAMAKVKEIEAKNKQEEIRVKIEKDRAEIEKWKKPTFNAADYRKKLEIKKEFSNPVEAKNIGRQADALSKKIQEADKKVLAVYNNVSKTQLKFKKIPKKSEYFKFLDDKGYDIYEKQMAELRAARNEQQMANQALDSFLANVQKSPSKKLVGEIPANAGGVRPMSLKDAQAYEHAIKHPEDPLSAEILRVLGR